MNRIWPSNNKRTSWTDLGSCEVEGSVCEWTCHLAIRPEPNGFWSIRWRGKEADPAILGPDHLDSLAEQLVEEYNVERDDLLDMFEFCGIEAVEEFAHQNRTE